jgi:cytochrome c-type biogenesis protein CcmH
MIWLGFAALVALSLGLILRPLLAAPGDGDARRAEYDLGVYQDQLGEIDRDLERGLLSADQAGAARLEIQRRMLAAADKTDQAPKAPAKAARLTALILTVLLPLGAGFVYLLLGAPGLPDAPYAARVGQIAQMKERSAAIKTMVDRLAERLKNDPNDGKGWAMLGRSYRALGRMDESKSAYVKAIALLPRDVQVRVEYAMLLLDEGEGSQMPPEVANLMLGVLAIEPDQPDALYFLGVDAAMRGDKDQARAMWTRLLAVIPPDSAARPQVQKQLDGLTR